MSAFICSDRHIATIAIRYCELVKSQSDQGIANQLKAINIASVNHRYNRNTPVSPCDLSETAPAAYQFPDLVALCDCLDYQSCELPEYSNPLLESITAAFRASCRHSIPSPVWSI